MPDKLSINNLSLDTTKERFEEVAAAHGRVAHAIIMRDSQTNASRGFGFVDYESAQDLAAAEKALNGFELDGNKLRTSKAR